MKLTRKRNIHKWTTRNTIAIRGANNGVRFCCYCRVCKLLVWGRMLMQYLLQLLSLPKLMKFYGGIVPAVAILSAKANEIDLMDLKSSF
jgi:hypothetical protein